MNEKILWAKDHKELYDLLEQALQRHYKKLNETMDWLNEQASKVEVWKN